MNSTPTITLALRSHLEASSKLLLATLRELSGQSGTEARDLAEALSAGASFGILIELDKTGLASVSVYAKRPTGERLNMLSTELSVNKGSAH